MQPAEERTTRIHSMLTKHIGVLDGAMATAIRTQHQLCDASFKGERFADHSKSLEGNYDILCITQPQIVKDIHMKYLEAGAHIISTNTFNSNRISQEDYDLQHLVDELNHAGARIARECIQQLESVDPTPRFVAGSMGPSNKSISRGNTTHEELVRAHKEQARALYDGGVDILLLETIYGMKSGLAAVKGITDLFAEPEYPPIPLFISVTIDKDGHISSGEELEEFYKCVAYAHPTSIGVNCGWGTTAEMKRSLEKLSSIAGCYVHCYPNAGLPNSAGSYDQEPEVTAGHIIEYAREGLLNMAGGCCGSDFKVISLIANAVRDLAPRIIPQTPMVDSSEKQKDEKSDNSGSGQSSVDDDFFSELVQFRVNSPTAIGSDKHEAKKSTEFDFFAEFADFKRNEHQLSSHPHKESSDVLLTLESSYNSNDSGSIPTAGIDTDDWDEFRTSSPTDSNNAETINELETNEEWDSFQDHGFIKESNDNDKDNEEGIQPEHVGQVLGDKEWDAFQSEPESKTPETERAINFMVHSEDLRRNEDMGELTTSARFEETFDSHSEDASLHSFSGQQSDSTSKEFDVHKVSNEIDLDGIDNPFLEFGEESEENHEEKGQSNECMSSIELERKIVQEENQQAEDWGFGETGSEIDEKMISAGFESASVRSSMAAHESAEFNDGDFADHQEHSTLSGENVEDFDFDFDSLRSNKEVTNTIPSVATIQAEEEIVFETKFDEDFEDFGDFQESPIAVRDEKSEQMTNTTGEKAEENEIKALKKAEDHINEPKTSTEDSPDHDFDEEFEDFQANTSIEANSGQSEDNGEDWDFKEAGGSSDEPQGNISVPEVVVPNINIKPVIQQVFFTGDSEQVLKLAQNVFETAFPLPSLVVPQEIDDNCAAGHSSLLKLAASHSMGWPCTTALSDGELLPTWKGSLMEKHLFQLLGFSDIFSADDASASASIVIPVTPPTNNLQATKTTIPKQTAIAANSRPNSSPSVATSQVSSASRPPNRPSVSPAGRPNPTPTPVSSRPTPTPTPTPARPNIGNAAISSRPSSAPATSRPSSTITSSTTSRVPTSRPPTNAHNHPAPAPSAASNGSTSVRRSAGNLDNVKKEAHNIAGKQTVEPERKRSAPEQTTNSSIKQKKPSNEQQKQTGRGPSVNNPPVASIPQPSKSTQPSSTSTSLPVASNPPTSLSSAAMDDDFEFSAFQAFSTDGKPSHPINLPQVPFSKTATLPKQPTAAPVMAQTGAVQDRSFSNFVPTPQKQSSSVASQASASQTSSSLFFPVQSEAAAAADSVGSALLDLSFLESTTTTSRKGAKSNAHAEDLFAKAMADMGALWTDDKKPTTNDNNNSGDRMTMTSSKASSNQTEKDAIMGMFASSSSASQRPSSSREKRNNRAAAAAVEDTEPKKQQTDGGPEQAEAKKHAEQWLKQLPDLSFLLAEELVISQPRFYGNN